MASPPPRVLLVAEHASARFGGEAILPLHYFRVLRARGVETWMIVHERTREELTALFPRDRDRLYFVPDVALHRLLWCAGTHLPGAIHHFTVGLLSGLLTQRTARQLAGRLVAEKRIDVVHQPIPVSPREVSILHGMGAPVVIGPMNGGMSYPPAFRFMEKGSEAAFIVVGRQLANALNGMFRGKRLASTLLAANPRTKDALPNHTHGKMVMLVENGVDLGLWKPRAHSLRSPAQPARFMFAGRFLELKGIDLLLEAFRTVAAGTSASLDLIGDGPPRPAYEAQARAFGLADRVRFLGWVPQAAFAEALQSADVFVLPSLHECGGAVVLEAMACAVPVVATRWGGPADYLDDSCGILVEPTSREALVAGLSQAMLRLASDPTLRRRMGEAGRDKVAREYDWERKIDRMLEIYQEATRRFRRQGRGAPRPIT